MNTTWLRTRRWVTALASAATVVVVVGVIVAAIALAGGGSPHGKTETQPPSPSPTPTSLTADELEALTKSVACPQRPEAVAAETLKSFIAVTVVTCGQDERQYDGEGQWLVDVRKVATEGAAALQAAFELPSEPLGGAGVACTANLVVVPPLILVDADGKTLAPTAPQTVCGQPRQEVLQAAAAATWHEVSVRRVRQLVTPQAQAAHCEMQWKNENWTADQVGSRRSDGGPVFMQTPTRLHVCFYDVTGKDPEVGDFVRVLDLSGADAAALADALAGPGPTGSCPTQRAFAVVHLPVGDWANVELGGCWRVARSYPNFATGSADAATVRRLLDHS